MLVLCCCCFSIFAVYFFQLAIYTSNSSFVWPPRYQHQNKNVTSKLRRTIRKTAFQPLHISSEYCVFLCDSILYNYLTFRHPCVKKKILRYIKNLKWTGVWKTTQHSILCFIYVVINVPYMCYIQYCVLYICCNQCEAILLTISTSYVHESTRWGSIREP